MGNDTADSRMKGVFRINFQKISLEDKPLFDKIFKQRKYESSECTFTNLYMWREAYSIEWCLEEDLLCVKAAAMGGSPYVLPPYGFQDGKLGGVIDTMLDYFKQNGWIFSMRGITVPAMKLIERVRPGLFEFTADRNNFDYIYSAEELITLKGSKFRNKQNHINYFKRTYMDYQYLSITAELLEPCKKAAEEWCRQHNDQHDPGLEFEKEAIIDVLSHYEYLGVTGGVLLVNNNVEAFTYGEPLNEEMAVIHIEKGSELRGVYQMINQEFCRNAWANMQYINREEDMGLPGLRRAKESYRPVRFTEKYTATLK